MKLPNVSFGANKYGMMKGKKNHEESWTADKWKHSNSSRLWIFLFFTLSEVCDLPRRTGAHSTTKGRDADISNICFTLIIRRLNPLSMQQSAVCLQLSVLAMLQQRLQVEIDVLFSRLCSCPSLHITRLWFWHHSWTKSMFRKNNDFLHRLSCVSPKTHSFSFSCARLETAEFSIEYGVFTLIYLLYLLPDDSNQMKSSFHSRIHWTICWLFSGDIWCFQRNERSKRMYKKPAQISNNNLCKFFSVVPPCRFRLCARWQKRRKFALQNSVFIFRLQNVPFSLICALCDRLLSRKKNWSRRLQKKDEKFPIEIALSSSSVNCRH